MVVLAPGGPPMSRRVYLSHLDMPQGRLPVLARFRHVHAHTECLLIEADRKLPRRGRSGANDPISDVGG
jgi:hypothetical protein